MSKKMIIKIVLERQVKIDWVMWTSRDINTVTDTFLPGENMHMGVLNTSCTLAHLCGVPHPNK